MHKLGMAVIGLALLCLCSSKGQAQCTTAGSIMSVTNTSAGIYEYVTFELKRPLNSNYGYSVTTVFGSSFVEDPSGNTITVAGSKKKKIRFKGIYWTCAITENLSLPKTAIKDIKRIKQYEGIVEYVVGYRNASIFLSISSSNVSPLIRRVRMKFRK